MTRDEAAAYARQWADDWNRRDLDAVLAHCTDDVVWSSPKALQVVGAPTVHGKVALRDYLRAAVQTVTVLRFSVHRVIWDPESAELAIVYDRDLDGRRDRASEILHFGPAGRIDRGEVHYGVVPDAESA